MIVPKDLESINIIDLFPDSIDSFFVNTGVPHAIYLVEDLEKIDVQKEGSKIRQASRFPSGTNVDFLQMDGYKLRTYERGVEGETLSCGTGAVAAAIFLGEKHEVRPPVKLNCRGGVLTVDWQERYKDIFLSGEVQVLDKGKILIETDARILK